ncbi:hypothetical protein, partial [Akkermansia sp.]|uniref:hypothetical protein n=1 Tax=Akkermansia sp. TaxID=1872421 RepID=UPI003A8B5FD0
MKITGFVPQVALLPTTQTLPHALLPVERFPNSAGSGMNGFPSCAPLLSMGHMRMIVKIYGGRSTAFAFTL